MSNAIISVDCHPNRDFWTIASEMKTRLNQDIRTGRVYHWVLVMTGLMDSASDAMRWALPAFATQPVNYDFSMTNLGRLSLPTQGGTLKLEAVYGPVVNTSEQELTVGVSTVCDRLTMTLAYRDFVLSPENAKKWPISP